MDFNWVGTIELVEVEAGLSPMSPPYTLPIDQPAQPLPRGTPPETTADVENHNQREEAKVPVSNFYRSRIPRILIDHSASGAATD